MATTTLQKPAAKTCAFKKRMALIALFAVILVSILVIRSFPTKEKELSVPADIARCHAVGQTCSVVHTAGHALGYPMYELTAIVLELGLDNCRDAVEQCVMYYEKRLRYWMEFEKTCQQNWAGFLKK